MAKKCFQTGATAMRCTRIAADVGRNASIYVADQFDALFLRLEHQHVAHALDAGLEVEIEVLERHLAHLQLAEVQDVVHLNRERERERKRETVQGQA